MGLSLVSAPAITAARERVLGTLRRRRVLLLVLAFLPLGVLTAIGLVYGRRVQDLESLGYFGVLLVNIVGSGTFILPVPGLAVAFAAGGVLNPILVGLAGSTGSTLGELTGYFAGLGSHTVIGEVVARNSWYKRIEAWVLRYGVITIFLFAATPNLLFDVAGFAAGSLGYPLRLFLLACWLGKTLKFTLFALVGSWSLQALLDLFNR